MYGKYSKKEDYDLFGYTYISAKPENEIALQNQAKPDEVAKTQVPKSKVEQATERLRNNPSSGFAYIKKDKYHKNFKSLWYGQGDFFVYEI